jgi:hypothetical protein
MADQQGGRPRRHTLIFSVPGDITPGASSTRASIVFEYIFNPPAMQPAIFSISSRASRAPEMHQECIAQHA